jgi:hypothetical protein
MEEKIKRTLELQDELMEMHGVLDVYCAVERFSIFALQQTENAAINQVYITLLHGLAIAVLQPYDEKLTFKLLDLVREAAAGIMEMTELTNEKLSACLLEWHPDDKIKVYIFDINVLIAGFGAAEGIWSANAYASGTH